jgi:transcriptional regulator with XRE-family HTH domain
MSLGDQIHKRRLEKHISLPELARLSRVAKGYLWEIEDGSATRPSAETLYRIAKVLGTSIADLLGYEVVATQQAIPDTLREYAQEARLPDSDVAMLASIVYRGEQPKTKEDWRYIYESIRRTISGAR